MKVSSQVAILRTRPETVVADYGRLMRLVKYDQTLRRDQDLLVKLNLSWTKYFPACSSQPWQLDGVLTTLLQDGYDRARILAVENKTVVTDPVAGCRNNKWAPVLERHGVEFQPLTTVAWTVHRFAAPLLKLNELFPEGIEIPAMYVGKSVLQLPTIKCVHPDTGIVLADGAVVRAEALVKESQVHEPTVFYPDGDQEVEGRVCVLSLSRSGVIGRHVTQFWRTPVADGEMWSVHTQTGRVITTSSRHPFLTPEGWVRANELRTGDRVAIVRRMRVDGQSQPLPRIATLGHEAIAVDDIVFRPGRRHSVALQRELVRGYRRGQTIIELADTHGLHWESVRGIITRYGIQMRWRRVWATAPTRTSPDFWRWVGYFTAEGYANEASGSYRVSLANTDPDIRADYIDLCRRLFSVDPRTRDGEIDFDAVNLRPFFESLGFTVPTNSATKTVPDLLFKCPDAEIAAFLQGYFDGDGTVDGRTGVSATTKSRCLASQIQMLLSRLGVVAFVRATFSQATNGRMSAKAPYQQIGVYGDDVVELSRWITLRCRQKQARLMSLAARRQAGVRPRNWDTIPVPPPLFRMGRRGLGLTQLATGRPACANTLEGGRGELTRRIVRHFIEVCSTADVTGRDEREIAFLRFLATDDIAWDRVEEVRREPADVPFFYDLSVEGTHAFVGNGFIVHNTHGHSVTTGAIKNAFGGLLKEVRHYAHEFMHEVLVDLMSMQRELHPGVFAVMDGTVMGDGAGPRTMRPRVGNVILASADQVAIDAIAARLMGFDPLSIRYLAMCHERGFGVADPRDIELVGDVDAATPGRRFTTTRSLVIWGDQLIRRGPLRPLKRLLLHSPLVVWAPVASTVYHDWLWYPTVGRARIREYAATPWGRLFARY